MSSVEDAGEFIPHAKKHQASKRASGAARSEGPSRLEQLWPEPDWVALSRAKRYSPRTLSALAVGYWSLAPNPLDREIFGVKAHEWPALYDGAVAIVRQVFEEATNESLNELYKRAAELAGITHKSSTQALMRLSAAGRFGGRRLYPPFRATPKLKWLHPSMAELGWPEDGAVMAAGIGISAAKSEAKPEDALWMVISTKPFPRIVNGAKGLTRPVALERAREAIRSYVELEEQGRALRKKVTSRNSSDLEQRIGPDYLQGRDIQPDELLSTFRLRGVQFGESLSTPERQRWVNEAYCALHDLARVIGFSPQWLGLGGDGTMRLAMAAAARGAGKAMAHYEPHLRVLNLTRLRGAGSLAHEWGHALDNHLCARTFCQGYAGGAMEFFSSVCRYMDVSESPRPDAFRAFLKISDLIWGDGRGDFYQQAMAIEDLKGERKDYWSRPLELLARSFEAFVEDRLIACDESSPWLVHGTLEIDQEDPRLSPYPLGSERKQLRSAWEEFLRTLGAKI